MTALNIASLLGYCVIVTFTPGPTNIVILSGSYNFGIKKTLQFVYGATAAFVVLLSFSVILSGLLMAGMPKILLVMQATGGIYMLYLARLIYGADGANTSPGQAFTFVGGFLMQLVNPKVIIFTMTVIPSFIMPYDTSVTGLAIAVAAVTSIAFMAMLTWALFGAAFKERLQKYRKTVNLIMGLFLVYSAIMMSGIVDLIKG
ncbi:LysE family translocator [Anaeroselena agilis]|uniref:LysE family translocator n=1 Tax=Anaeroselena agilis TaxID=3063788 RepID=A0ABU3NT53_9FIRM|nr:LysE family translocator [Selenomonadales bacterium 4137-cl]